MKRVQMGQFGHAREKQLTVIATEFLGKNKGYLSNIIKSGRTLGNYEIVVGEL